MLSTIKRTGAQLINHRGLRSANVLFLFFVPSLLFFGKPMCGNGTNRAFLDRSGARTKDGTGKKSSGHFLWEFGAPRVREKN